MVPSRIFESSKKKEKAKSTNPYKNHGRRTLMATLQPPPENAYPYTTQQQKREMKAWRLTVSGGGGSPDNVGASVSPNSVIFRIGMICTYDVYRNENFTT
ncbi:hypothetical protein HKD37_03G008881 [Glycine soja]